MNIESTISLLTALTVLMLGLLQWRSTARAQVGTHKVQSAEASERIGNAYDKLLEAQNKRMDDMEQDIIYLKKELKKYTNWSARLVKQLIEHGIEPVHPPDTGELMNKS